MKTNNKRKITNGFNTSKKLFSVLNLEKYNFIEINSKTKNNDNE